MKTNDWLAASCAELEKSGITTARLDCLVLLEDCTGKDRSWLLAHPDYDLNDSEVSTLNRQLQQRSSHEPLAYIRGRTEFYGREFVLTADVLEPRPESETMIDMLKSLKITQDDVIVDVGTGSGALGITAAMELQHPKVELIDIDDSALEVARNNCRRLKLNLSIYKSDLLAQVNKADILLANLPYVPDDYHINEAAMMEPRLAIFGGQDGLDLYRRLFEEAASKDVRNILTEALPFQHESLAQIAEAQGYTQIASEGFIQHFSATS